MRDKMDINDFDIFGDNIEKADKSNISPPKIDAKKGFHTMSILEVETTIERIRRLSNRSVSCLITGKNLEKSNVEQFSWAIYLLEQALLSARELANEFENEGYDERKLIDYEQGSSTITIENNLVSIDLPLLVPKRKASQHTSYYCDKLDRMLKSETIPDCLKSEKVAIIFLHCYEKRHAEWAKRDHDNLEIKWIIDALNNHFFVDDGPFRTSLYNHTVVDSYDHTVVYIMPISDFPGFLLRVIPVWEEMKSKATKI